MQSPRFPGSLRGGAAAFALAVGLGVSSGAALSADLVVNAGVAPSTLDPAWACGTPEISLTQNFYVRLVQPGIKDGPDGTHEVDYSKHEPWLAESWDVSDDGLVYTFHLKDGFKFASGAPVDAEAVRYSLQRVMDMAGCGRFFLTDGHLDPVIIKSIEAPDARTVVISLNAPNGNMLGDLATHAAGIVDPAVVEANGGVTPGAPNEYMASHVAASGPFDMAAYTPNQSIRLVRNPNYGAEPAKPEAVTVNWITAAPTLLLQARTGQADVTYDLSKQAASTLKTNPGTRVIAFSNPFAQQLMMRNNTAPWDNKLVREAAALAIPYEDIIKKIAYGWGTAYYGPIPPSLTGFNAELSKPLPYDVEKAKALIAESGVATPIKTEVMIQEGEPTQAQLATIVQSVWKQIGIDLSIKVAPAAEFQELSQGHKMPALMRLDGPGVFETGYYWGYDLICGISFNLSDICLKDADPMIDEMRASSDPAKRQEIMDKVTEMWRAEYPKIIFFEDKPVVVLSEKVKDFTFAPFAEFRFVSK